MIRQIKCHFCKEEVEAEINDEVNDVLEKLANRLGFQRIPFAICEECLKKIQKKEGITKEH